MSDGTGETQSDAAEDSPPLPDISDIEGATTGPPRRPAATGDETAPIAADWAAPSVDDLKEAVAEGSVAAVEGPGVDGPEGGGGEPTRPFNVITPQPPPANPTVSIDARQVGSGGGASRAVTTAAAVPIGSTVGDTTVPGRPPDPTGDVVDELTITADESAAGSPPPSSVDPPQPGSSETAISGSTPTKTRRRRRLPKLLALGVLAVVVLFLGAWLADSARTSNQVVRNTTLGDLPIGGLDRDELGTVIDELDAQLATAPMTVTVDDVPIATNPGALGARLDREAVIEEALAAGRGGSLIERPFRWVASFSNEQTVDPAYVVDPEVASAAVAGVIGDALVDPLEPALVVENAELSLSPGSDGVTVDPAEIAEALPAVLDEPEPYSLALSPVAVTPAVSNEAVEAVIAEANEATAEPVVFEVLDQRAEVESAAIRDWVRLDSTGAEPTWAIATEPAITDLQPRFPVLGSDEQQARFEVVDGVPEILPATETVICCEPTSVENIRDALLQPAPVPEDSEGEGNGDDDEEEAPLRTIALEPEIVSPDAGVAELESLGIIEEVSTFTTNHPCCAPRVTNIQRFADLMRGVIIRPGEDFSLNDHVGRRTIENGFVADQAIANGILEPQVGGGISQFATTFFNASFFAGLDFNEYQSHSLFIDRYPRGREATISFPRPDLSVNNSTDYGILVWTSYTDTSITVTFYSTKHIDVVAGDLIRSAQGAACTRYTTPRIRTYPDGTVVEDSVFAVYRPGEGLDCEGNSTVPEEDQPAGPTTPAPQPDTTQPDDAAPAEPPAETTPTTPTTAPAAGGG